MREIKKLKEVDMIVKTRTTAVLHGSNILMKTKQTNTGTHKRVKDKNRKIEKVYSRKFVHQLFTLADYFGVL